MPRKCHITFRSISSGRIATNDKQMITKVNKGFKNKKVFQNRLDVFSQFLGNVEISIMRIFDRISTRAKLFVDKIFETRKELITDKHGIQDINLQKKM